MRRVQKSWTRGSVSGAAIQNASMSTSTRPIDAIRIAKLLERPDMADRILERLSPGKRRYLLVAAGSAEWQPNAALSTTMDAVDADQDAKISAQEYIHWVERSLESKHGLSWRTLLLVAIHAGAPFVAFGCLDNSLMLLSGDAIDGMFGERFGLTAMGAAALGGICSGTIGIQVHGMAERAVQRTHLIPNPTLSASQRKHRAVFRASHIGGTVGILCGLSLGMFPLLFIGRPPHSIAVDLAAEAASS